MTEQQKRTTLTAEQEQLNSFREYLLEREHADATIRKYMADIRTFFNFFQGQEEIGKEELIRYKGWLNEQYAVSSANSMLAALNQFLVFAGVPALRVKRFRVQKQMFASREKELTREEYLSLVKSAREAGKGELALLMETICATGIRVSELSCFTVQEVRKGRLEVRNKGKLRIILIPDALKKKLLYFAYRRKIGRGPIFITRGGRPRDRSNIWAEMKALHKRAGVTPRKIFPHNLRHLFARTYYRQNKDIAGLADLLGHNSLETTRIYMASPCEIYKKRLEKMRLVIESTT